MWRNAPRYEQDTPGGHASRAAGESSTGKERLRDARDADQDRRSERPTALSRSPQRTGSRASARPAAHSGLSQIAADRPIFTLSVAADLLGLHPRTLRIYEEKKLVVPARTEGNRRRYSQNDIQRFQFIRHLTRAGVNLEGVRVILDMADELSKLGGDPNAIIDRNLQVLKRDQQRNEA